MRFQSILKWLIPLTFGGVLLQGGCIDRGDIGQLLVTAGNNAVEGVILSIFTAVTDVLSSGIADALNGGAV